MREPSTGTIRVMVRRHSRLVRATHWVNAISLCLLLLSGLQIFNAHPDLYFGQQSHFGHPWLGMGAYERGGSLHGVTFLGGHPFDTTGFRVPFIVVSPYAKAHFASHVVHDHTSLVRFIEARFGLPAMTNRDANATPPMEMFDFKNPPFMTPPSITATTPVPANILAQCNQTLAPLTCQ